MANELYFGDNLDVLRESIDDESVDLIYLDPPFNSNATYNQIFKTPEGHKSDAQIEAFDDTWHWGPSAEIAYTEVIQGDNTDAASMMVALRQALSDNDVMAYLAMMGVRLIELHRKLKPTGSLYLHCDPTASHYLKLLLDQIFGAQNFRNEIVWKRTSAHSDSQRAGRIHDTILFYGKSDMTTWNKVFQPYDQDYVDAYYRYKDDDGRMWASGDVAAAGPGPAKLFNGVLREPPPGSHWRYSQEKINEYVTGGRIYFTKNGFPRYKRYLDDMEGIPLQDIWADKEVQPVVSWSSEGLGYPTQKPVGLLERIIRASSNEGDLVLDPFCGCGTAVDAAEKLKRRWIGIDVTHLAVSLIEKRMRDRYAGIEFEVHGTPKDIDGARNLAERDKHQFEWWAVSLVNAKPAHGKKKGADSGIDGILFFPHDGKSTAKIVVSVKGGESVGVAQVRDLAHVIDREKAAMGFFVTLTPPTKPMVSEAAGTGFYTSPLTGAKFPKLQILTIEGLLHGNEQARYPHLDAGALTFKKAKKEKQFSEKDQGTLL